MSAPIIRVTIWLLVVLSLYEARRIRVEDVPVYRQKVVDMFHHAYDGYIKYAYPLDELRPLTCDGHDTWGSYSLTLIDALDMLVIIGNNTEFQRVAQLVMDKMNFDVDINVSVFETNIRVVGGLISAHLMSKRGGLDLEPGWPCSGPLLRMAEDVARRLLPAFDTATGMPYGTVNLMYGVPKGETTVTCTAGVGTFLVEFGALSKLTGDPIFEKVAMKAMNSLWMARSEIGLVGNHIDVATGKWTALDAGIGGGIDSYFEYLVKGSIMFHNPQLLEMYNEYFVSVEKYLKRDDWYMWAHMTKGSISLPVFTSLDCYLPGIQAMLGDIDKGMKTIHNFHQVWKQFGFLPEFYNIVKNEAHLGREGYPLRPELIEAAMYLYQATKDPYLLEIGADMLHSIEHNTRTSCGYATVKDVNTHTLENRMESFFLAETTKYLYLLFDPDNFIHNTGDHGTITHTPNGQCIIDTGSYVFNTEAHPIDTAALYCCSAQKKEDDYAVEEFHDNLDLLALLDITDKRDEIQGVRWTKDRKQNGTVGEGDGIMESLVKGNKQAWRTDIKGEHQKILSTKGQKFTLGSNYKNLKITIAGDGIQVVKKDTPKKSFEIKDPTPSDTDSDPDEKSCSEGGNCDSSELKQNKKKYSASVNEKSDQNDPNEDMDKVIDHRDDIDEMTDNEENDKKNNNRNEEEEEDPFEEYNANDDNDENKREKPTLKLTTFDTNGEQSKTVSKKHTDVLELLKSLTNNILTNSGVKSLKTLHEKLKYYSLYQKPKPELMTCKAQPFYMRFSIVGEMFLNDL